ncbi:hypothetical protein ACVIHI_008106 [Bradyrhizobium sp. USDA 4524]|nr:MULTISPECIES: hypothetical protein [unclassified Bradyrhizobium]MCP1838975.1 hypothetical protein [Bradyrhizobium sp. USDA 4538]MCP1899542.1 hypothetical protein [Bradyrhizobium sp. USDA 4537]ODM71579.1 hypothetical protein A6X20_41100 [Bradyrhizobium elkanii]ODM79345.1 hypothetical protein A6452_28210 [Bradyrhizobium elkanii]
MMMTKENGINNDIGIAAGAFQDFTKRVIGTQNELLKKYSEAYWHWQERLQTESTQLTEFFKEVSSTTSAPDQIGVLQAWVKGAKQRVTEDFIYSIETAKALTNVGLQA